MATDAVAIVSHACGSIQSTSALLLLPAANGFTQVSRQATRSRCWSLSSAVAIRTTAVDAYLPILSRYVSRQVAEESSRSLPLVGRVDGEPHGGVKPDPFPTGTGGADPPHTSGGVG